MKPKDKQTDYKQTKNDPTNIELEQIIMDTCLRTGKFLNENAFNISSLNWKSLDDPVTNLDKTAEQMIRSDILKAFPANIIGEEYGMKKKRSNITIYVDPIDGTKSYCRGEFIASISVAAEKNGELVVGVVYDFMKDIIYYANPEGAFVIRSIWNSQRRLPATTFELKKPTFAFDNADDFLKGLDNDVYARIPIGSVALNMAQLATGSYDGLIMRPWKKSSTDVCDIAAGYFILKQAGLYLTDIEHKPFDYKHPYNGLIAINDKRSGVVQGRIIEKILSVSNNSDSFQSSQKFDMDNYMRVMDYLYHQEERDIDRMCKKYFGES